MQAFILNTSLGFRWQTLPGIVIASHVMKNRNTHKNDHNLDIELPKGIALG